MELAGDTEAFREMERRERIAGIVGGPGSFPQQTAFIRDPARLKAADCTRRAGKSMGAGLLLVETCLKFPGVTCLYTGLTRESAKRIICKDVLSVINREHALGMVQNRTELSWTFPNGSVIYILGVDADEDEKQKALGQKYKLVIVDEGAEYGIDLRALVYEVLMPATADLKGAVCLIGTPSVLTKGLYYDVVTGKEPGWSVHKWSALDNPNIDWAGEIATVMARQPGIENTPGFKRQYLGQWVIDTEALVYRYTDAKNSISQAAWESLRDNPCLSDTWHYGLGIDLGYEDDTSFTVAAYNDHLPTLYLLSSRKEPKLDVTATATQAKALGRAYSFDDQIVDGANKQAVEEMKFRHGLPLIAADKAGKMDFIEIMNAEFICGQIVLVQGGCEQLIEEYKTLVKDPRKDVPAEHPACPNHCADSALYIWRRCYQYLSNALIDRPAYKSAEWYEEQEATMKARLIEQSRPPQSHIEPLPGEAWDSW